jgi:hypothetical protein
MNDPLKRITGDPLDDDVSFKQAEHHFEKVSTSQSAPSELKELAKGLSSLTFGLNQLQKRVAKLGRKLDSQN